LKQKNYAQAWENNQKIIGQFKNSDGHFLFVQGKEVFYN
jgi:hypothetical protein